MYFHEDDQLRLEEYTNSIDRGFLSQHQYYKRFIAVNAFKHKKILDTEQLKELMKYIRQTTGLFSPFRSNSFAIGAMLMTNYKDPRGAFDRLQEHFRLLKGMGFRSSTFLPMASYTLDSIMFDDKIQDMAIQTESYRQELVEKSKEVYDEMKKNHPWLTGGDDYPLAILIAHSGKDMERIESIYDALNQNGLKKGNNLQSLANIIALSEEEERTIVDKVIDIADYCKKEGFRVNQTMYPGIGLMALVSEKAEYMQQVIDATKELKSIKKYKWLDKNLLFMFAVNLVSEDIKNELSSKTISETMLNITVEQLVMAQTAVIVAAIAASSSAAATT